MNDEQTNYFLLWGLRTFKDIYFLDELKQLAADQQHFMFKICLSQEKSLETIPNENRKYFSAGRVTKELDNQITNYQLQITKYDFYLCGAKEVVDSLRIYLLQKGVKQENIHSERFV